MSIITKTGDAGSTGLMYNRRVPKTHNRVAAYGTVDELNAALGVARATISQADFKERLERIQKQLVMLMGELATLPEDAARYVQDGFPVLKKEMTSGLERWAHDVEAKNLSFKGWATPGANAGAAALDLARTVCRRAERDIWSLQEKEKLANSEIPIYLNRLSDLLWLWARELEIG